MLHFLESFRVGESGSYSFTFQGNVPGVLWIGEAAGKPRPLILIGHGGGQDEHAPSVLARAKLLNVHGYDAVALAFPAHGGRPRSNAEDAALTHMRHVAGSPLAAGPAVTALNNLISQRAVPEWMQLITDLDELGLPDNRGPVGYWGLSLGAAIGFALLAEETRVGAAVLGLVDDHLARLASSVTVPVQFLLQWDDQIIDRPHALKLFDSIASHDKTLHAHPGDHHEVPVHEHETALGFFDRTLRTG